MHANATMALAPKMGREEAHDRLLLICRQVAEGKGKLIDLLAKRAGTRRVLQPLG